LIIIIIIIHIEPSQPLTNPAKPEVSKLNLSSSFFFSLTSHNTDIALIVVSRTRTAHSTYSYALFSLSPLTHQRHVLTKSNLQNASTLQDFVDIVKPSYCGL